jgi:glycosyltransferase involved in cell wall biosynthesis
LGYGFCRPHHPFVQLPADRLHDLSVFSAVPLWRQWKLAHAFAHRTAFLKDYDTVIYSGFYAPLAIGQHQGGCNILYCHTPPRFIYDQRDFYLHRLPYILRPALRAFIHYLQPRYEAAISQMDAIVVNSRNVWQRVRRYLKSDALIIHPPCETDRFRWCGQGDYYLSTARLDPLKRVDAVVKAFLAMPDKRLIITSGGTELAYLRRLASRASNIEFTGWVDDKQLNTLVGNAIATLYLASDEDFGMSPVESMSAGKPVIGVAEGGLQETCIPGVTGILLPPSFRIEDICTAVCTLTSTRALTMRLACEAQANCFRTELFLRQMHEVIVQVPTGIRS